MNSEKVFNAIDCVVGRFKRSPLHIRRHFCAVECEEGEYYEIHFYIEGEIETMLNGLNIKNSVRLIDMYRAVDFDVYVLAIAFVIDGELYTVDYVVEGDNY